MSLQRVISLIWLNVLEMYVLIKLWVKLSFVPLSKAD